MPVVETQTDPMEELRERRREIERREHAKPSMDSQEAAERGEAAAALAVEQEQLLVDYAADCIRNSTESLSEIRRVQDHCWRTYNEDEPAGYGNKDAWQSRVVVPKPFATVEFGAAVIRKAFSPDFLSIEDDISNAAREFWKTVLDIQNDGQRGRFVHCFSQAVTMALAVGVSMEIIPRWIPGQGLQYALIEPWKILRDPDAPAADPQGGLYWVHQEWLDWHVLKAGETGGKYFDIERVRNIDGSGSSTDPFVTKDAIEARKKQTYRRGGFRTLHLTAEIYGTILDKRGEVILPRGQYTVCGGRVIEMPKSVPYARLRWPGVAFSPFPALLSFGGRGLLKGIVSVWETMCSLQCLFEDALQWLVNPTKEICADNLVDSRDVEDWPGKKYLVKETIQGQSVVRETKRHDMTGSILANQQYHDQLFQRGSFVTDAVQGLPGYRKDITWRESQQNLSQGQSVFELIGSNVEAGAVATLAAAQDVVQTFAGWQDYEQMFGASVLGDLGVVADPGQKNGVRGLPKLSGRFHVSGISALMKDAETLEHLVKYIIPLSERPRYAAYIEPYKALKAIERRTNLADEGIIVDEETAGRIKDAQQAADAEQANWQKEQQGMADIGQLVELLGRLGVTSAGGDKSGKKNKRSAPAPAKNGGTKGQGE